MADLAEIERLLEGRNTQVEDLQFLIDPQGRLHVTDMADILPADPARGVNPSLDTVDLHSASGRPAE